MDDLSNSNKDGHVYCGGKDLAEDNDRSPLVDIAKAHLRKLLAVDNIGFLLGSGTSIDAGAPRMSDLSKAIIPQIKDECFDDDELFWPAVLESAWESENKFKMFDDDDDPAIGYGKGVGPR